MTGVRPAPRRSPLARATSGPGPDRGVGNLAPDIPIVDYISLKYPTLWNEVTHIDEKTMIIELSAEVRG
jgi:hypothetical protein